VRPEFPPLASHRACLRLASHEIYARWQAAGGLHNKVTDLLLTGVPPLQSTISGGIGLGMCRDAILDIKTDSERAVEVEHRKTLDEYRLSAEKLDREYADVPATPSSVRQGPGPFVDKF
jgi:hypothetical protein